MWDVILTLHLLAMALFVGGQLFLGLVVVPVERRHSDPTRLRAIARRFGYATLVSLVVLVATGVSMAIHLHRWSSTDLQVKLGLIAVLVGLIGWHLRRPRSPVLDAAILVGSLAIVYLGVRVAG